jgi:hypothetical protein
LHEAGVRGVRFNFVKRLIDFTPRAELMEIAGRIAKLGWHVVIYFEAVDLPELWDFFTALPTTVVVDHMGRPDVSKPVDGPEFELFMKFMTQHPNVWSKVTCPERRTEPLSRRDPVRSTYRRDVSGSRALGDRLAAPQPEGSHARRRPFGRLHPAHRGDSRTTAQTAGGQPDATLLARAILKDKPEPERALFQRAFSVHQCIVCRHSSIPPTRETAA